MLPVHARIQWANTVKDGVRTVFKGKARGVQRTWLEAETPLGNGLPSMASPSARCSVQNQILREVNAKKW